MQEATLILKEGGEKGLKNKGLFLLVVMERKLEAGIGLSKRD